MTNVRYVPPDQAWAVFQAWALRRLQYEPRGTTLTLVDAPRSIPRKLTQR
jgi:hypothetical protein